MIQKCIATFVASLVMAGLGGLGSPVQAQRVAIVDMAELFNAHPVFMAQLKQIEQEAKQLEQNVGAQRQKLAAEAEQLSLIYRANSPEFTEKEKSLAMESARIDLDAREQMRVLMRREASLHYDIYNEINQTIASFCADTGTQMVLRFSKIAVNEKNPDTIMQQVNAPVVWNRPDRDITPLILERLSRVQGFNPGTTDR